MNTKEQEEIKDLQEKTRAHTLRLRRRISIEGITTFVVIYNGDIVKTFDENQEGVALDYFQSCFKYINLGYPSDELIKEEKIFTK